MTTAAAIPLSVDDATPSAKARRMSGRLGLLASFALHGAVLACVAGWGGGQAEPPAEIEVAVMMVAEPEAPVPVPVAQPSVQPPVQPSTSPIVPPCPPVQPTAHPARSTPRHKASPAQRTAATSAGSSSSDTNPSSTPEPITAGTPPRSTQGDTAQGQEPTGTPSGMEGNGGGTNGAATDGPAAPSAGNPAPVYPMAARGAAREGRTILLVTVGADGECADVRIEETSGTPSLDEAAVAAVRRWRFTSARHAGKAIEATIRVPVAFKLTAPPQ